MTPTSADDTDTTGYSIDHLISQNGEWADANADWFKRHGHEKHAPKYLWIGCSDARTPANEILGEGPNAVFVHRNIANLVVNSDMNMLSVLQYAVNVLCVPHIIVCGHYDCGGVRASLSRSHLDSRDLGSPLEDWLRNIRDVQRLHAEELTAIKDPEQKVRRVVELNVIEQCLNIYKTGVVQRRRLLTSSVKSTFPQPRVHALVYNPLDGRLKQLDLDMRRYRSEMQAHYDIFAA